MQPSFAAHCSKCQKRSAENFTEPLTHNDIMDLFITSLSAFLGSASAMLIISGLALTFSCLAKRPKRESKSSCEPGPRLIVRAHFANLLTPPVKDEQTGEVVHNGVKPGVFVKITNPHNLPVWVTRVSTVPTRRALESDADHPFECSVLEGRGEGEHIINPGQTWEQFKVIHTNGAWPSRLHNIEVFARLAGSSITTVSRSIHNHDVAPVGIIEG